MSVCSKINRYPLSGIKITSHVSASATVDGISACAAFQRILTIPAEECVIVPATQYTVGIAATDKIIHRPIADNSVLPGRAYHILNVENLVARRITARSGVCQQIDIYRASRCGIVNNISSTRTAVEGVCAAKANQRVIAFTAAESISKTITCQIIAERGPYYSFNSRQNIAGCVAAHRTCIQHDLHSHIRCGIVSSVIGSTAR